MPIKNDEVVIYPIGLDSVPKRREWRMNTTGIGSPPSVYIPISPLAPRLIESPIAVRSSSGT
jgi:hypothetical protein